MDINFEYYKIFYYVAKYKNITRAAAALGSNQPNVTRVMKLLEEGLQCKLLVREARGIALTQEGERLYAHVEAAFHQLLKAQEEIGAQLLDGTGTVEIGATETALHLFLLDALRSFKETCPRVRINIHNFEAACLWQAGSGRDHHAFRDDGASGGRRADRIPGDTGGRGAVPEAGRREGEDGRSRALRRSALRAVESAGSAGVSVGGDRQRHGDL